MLSVLVGNRAEGRRRCVFLWVDGCGCRETLIVGIHRPRCFVNLYLAVIHTLSSLSSITITTAAVRVFLDLEPKGAAYFRGACPEFGQFGAVSRGGVLDVG